jgi:hypothetical protein
MTNPVTPTTLPMTAADHGRRHDRADQAMAACIHARLAHFGSCTIDDLARDGFTSAEIIEYEPEARLAAEQRLGTRRYLEGLFALASKNRRAA